MNLKRWLAFTASSAIIVHLVPTPVGGQLYPGVPDLTQITLQDLRISDSGSFTVPSEVTAMLGFDLSRTWYQGQPIVEILTLADMPGLVDTPLAAVEGWPPLRLSQVPSLTTLPLSTFIQPQEFRRSAAVQSPLPALVDIVFGPAENDRSWTVSGSYQEGFQVPCERECAHIELGQPLLGMQWISGKYQEVRGGFGLLAAINDGMEPTGRHPYGDSFKVVVWETDEASGTAKQALFFRVCSDVGCSPYVIGPVPWFPVQEEGWIVL